MSDTSNMIAMGLTAPAGVAVLVVASEPGRALLDVVEPLIAAGAAAIIVVDDGSSAARRWVLDRISLEPTVHILRHARPQGRGAALKTGMQYFMDHLGHYSGIVSTTADGQYPAPDVLRVMRALQRSPKLFIMGARQYAASAVLGATIADRMLAVVFRALTRVSLSDVQSRLRAIPTPLVPRLLRLPGSRYEFELAMLLHVARSGYPMAEHAVVGDSEPRRADESFRAVADSVSIVRTLLTRIPAELDLSTEASQSGGDTNINTRHRGVSRAQQTR